MTGDDFLETLQADVVAILKAVPTLVDVNIIPEDDGDMNAKITRMLGTLVGGSTAKPGCVAVVMLPEITEAEANLPGPPVEVLVKVQVIEQHTINRSATGSGVRSSEGALRVLNALHHQGLAYAALYADKKPVEPVEVKKGYLSHMVTLKVRYGALIGPGKPAQVEAEMGGGGSGIVISGTGIEGIDIELLPAGLENGKNSWTDDGAPFQGNTTVTAVVFSPAIPGLQGDQWQVLRIVSNSYEFNAYCDSSADSPVGLDFTVSELGQQGGDPIISAAVSGLTLTCSTAGSSIRYTTDGTYPDATNGTLYTAPITGLTTGTIVRAAAYKTGLNPGDVTEILITE